LYAAEAYLIADVLKPLLAGAQELHDGGYVPFAGNAFELVGSALLEFKPRPDHEVAQRAGHEHVVRPGQCAHTRADVYGDTTDVITANLALAGVQPGPHLDAERLDCVANRHGAADRSLRAVEHREEAIARRVHLAAPKASELRSDDGVMRVKQGVPVAVADLRCSARRVHDVGEEDGGENPIIGDLGMVAGEEFGDLLEGRPPGFNVRRGAGCVRSCLALYQYPWGYYRGR
jgi:hypothetical protein